MKTIVNIMRTVLQINLIVAGVLFSGACNNGRQSNADMSGNSARDTIATSKDAKFLARVAIINMEEIRLGQLAQQNSSTKDVKGLGEMMVDDHKKSQDELMQLAAKKSIILPASPDAPAEADYNQLASKTGNEFDKEYTAMMVNGHKDAIALFKSEASDANDSDIREWAGSVLPVLQKHLDYATECQRKCKNM
jgi:putative membrane protein